MKSFIFLPLYSILDNLQHFWQLSGRSHFLSCVFVCGAFVLQQLGCAGVNASVKQQLGGSSICRSHDGQASSAFQGWARMGYTEVLEKNKLVGCGGK